MSVNSVKKFGIVLALGVVLFSTILVSVGVIPVLAEGKKEWKGEELRGFVYFLDFEEKASRIRKWVSRRGKYTENFKGLTEEKAFSGKKSFKFDITFTKGGYVYYMILLSVPAEGKLNFSARILLGEETTGSADVGVNIALPQIRTSGCPGFGKCSSTSGEWKLIEGDLVERSKAMVERMPKKYWGLTKENIGAYIDRIGFYIYGAKGARVVIYVDDLKIAGRVPSETDYQKELQRRFAPYKKKVDNKVTSWESSLNKADKKIQSLTGLSEVAENMKEKTKSQLNSLMNQTKIIRKKGFIMESDAKKMDSSISELETSIKNIETLKKSGM